MDLVRRAKGRCPSSANFGADVWRPAVTSVGLRGFTFHGLRGVSATLAARQGATTKELMRRPGHATPTWLCDISEPRLIEIGALHRVSNKYKNCATLSPGCSESP